MLEDRKRFWWVADVSIYGVTLAVGFLLAVVLSHAFGLPVSRRHWFEVGGLIALVIALNCCRAVWKRIRRTP